MSQARTPWAEMSVSGIHFVESNVKVFCMGECEHLLQLCVCVRLYARPCWCLNYMFHVAVYISIMAVDDVAFCTLVVVAVSVVLWVCCVVLVGFELTDHPVGCWGLGGFPLAVGPSQLRWVWRCSPHLCGGLVRTEPCFCSGSNSLGMCLPLYIVYTGTST